MNTQNVYIQSQRDGYVVHGRLGINENPGCDTASSECAYSFTAGGTESEFKCTADPALLAALKEECQNRQQSSDNSLETVAESYDGLGSESYDGLGSESYDGLGSGSYDGLGSGSYDGSETDRLTPSFHGDTDSINDDEFNAVVLTVLTPIALVFLTIYCLPKINNFAQNTQQRARKVLRSSANKTVNFFNNLRQSTHQNEAELGNTPEMTSESDEETEALTTPSASASASALASASLNTDGTATDTNSTETLPEPEPAIALTQDPVQVETIVTDNDTGASLNLDHHSTKSPKFDFRRLTKRDMDDLIAKIQLLKRLKTEGNITEFKYDIKKGEPISGKLVFQNGEVNIIN